MSVPSFKFEKRAGPRRTFELEGTGRLMNRRVAGESAGVPLRTVNAGPGGVMITHDGELNAGDMLRVTFRAPLGVEPVDVTAQVVWQRRNGMRLLGAFTAGLAFVPAAQDGAARLLALADRAVMQTLQGGAR